MNAARSSFIYVLIILAFSSPATDKHALKNSPHERTLLFYARYHALHGENQLSQDPPENCNFLLAGAAVLTRNNDELKLITSKDRCTFH